MNLLSKKVEEGTETMKNMFAMSFSWFWSVFSALYILLVTFVTLPTANSRVVDQVLGFIMGTIVATIINYWVGSSAGQKEQKEVQDVSPTNAAAEDAR